MKFAAEELRAMNAHEAVGRLAEVDLKIGSLESKHRRSESDEAEIDDLRGQHRQLENHLGRLRFAEAQRTGDPRYAVEGTDGGVRRLDGTVVREPAHRDDQPSDQLSGLRSTALRRLDGCTRDGTMAADAATIYEKLIGTGSTTERTWMARYIDAAGSPDYLSAFAKKLADPEGARDRFSNAEVAAVRKVHEVNETRAMSLTDSAGGFTVPAQLDPAILLSSNGFINPIREMARVVQVTGDVWHGVTSAGASSRWAAEASEANDDSPTLAQPAIPVHRGDCFVPYSVEIEGDGAGFVTEISRVMIEAIDDLWATAFVTGDGSGEPLGFVTALVAAGGSVIVSGDGSEALANGDPVKMQNALPPRAQANSAWAMNLSTLNTLRLAETSNGSLLYPSLHNDTPTLLGRRVFEISTMDGVVNAAATEANYLIALGDWSRFVIADRVGTRVEIVSHLVGANRRPTGQRGFYAWFRTGSGVLTPNSFRLLNVPTAA
ncbi:MAG: phage major capsid protein [Mycobacterium sp.]